MVFFVLKGEIFRSQTFIRLSDTQMQDVNHGNQRSCKLEVRYGCAQRTTLTLKRLKFSHCRCQGLPFLGFVWFAWDS